MSNLQIERAAQLGYLIRMQEDFMRICGGDLNGYIACYSESKEQAAAIHKADVDYLARLRKELEFLVGKKVTFLV